MICVFGYIEWRKCIYTPIRHGWGYNAFSTGAQDMLWVAVRQTENNIVYTTQGPYTETHIYIYIEKATFTCTHSYMHTLNAADL